MQFLPATQPLVAEAVHDAISQAADRLTTRVMSEEHLMAIALQTGRTKDYARLVMFMEAGPADMTRHSLLDAWGKFEDRFLKP